VELVRDVVDGLRFWHSADTVNKLFTVYVLLLRLIKQETVGLEVKDLILSFFPVIHVDNASLL
jgi:hypothetical protein